MTFRQIVEDNDIVAFIEQELDANAPDVSRSADDKDFHPRKVRRTLPLSKESPPRTAGSPSCVFFGKREDHGADPAVFLCAARAPEALFPSSPIR